MCERCADLEEEVAFLKSELGIVEDAEELHELKLAFDLRGVNEARVLRHLYTAAGVVAKGALFDQLGHHPDCEPDIKLIDIYVCRLRKRIGFASIETIWAIGWRLSAPGRQRVSEVIDAYRSFKSVQKAARRAAA